MFRAVRVAAASLPAHRVAASTSSTALRAFSNSARRLAGGGAPQIYGPGAKNVEAIPSDEEQSTGLERFQLLGRMEGVDVFDMKPLDSSRLGTLDSPILVPSLFDERLVGCTGAPADSHDVIWLTVNTTLEKHRCPECGSVYKLDFQGDAHAHHH